MGKKIREKIKKSFYTFFRKVRYYLHLKPTFLKVKEFVKYYLFGLIKRIDEHHVFLLSGGLAFSLFVCIIPFVLIIFWILGNFLSSGDVQIQLNNFIDTIIPYQNYSDFVKSIITSRIKEVVQFKNVAGYVGIIGLFFAASGLSSSIRTILNKVFCPNSEINIVMGKLRDFALVLIAVLVLLIAALVFPFLDVLRNAPKEIAALQFFQFGAFQKILATLFSFIIIFLLYSSLYRFIPIKKLDRKSIGVGALSSTVMWEVARQLFGYYIYNFGSIGRIYGTYALLVVVAFWIYYSSIVFIIGAEISKLYFEKKFITNDLD